MEYRSNSFVVDAFEFTRKYDDRVAPFWFSKAVEDTRIYIDSSIHDGASIISGFTLYSKRGRIRGKCGDFVFRVPSGEIMVMSKNTFMALFRKNK